MGDVQRASVEAHGHLVRQLTDRYRRKEFLLLCIEDLNAVIAGIRNVEAAASLIEHEILKALGVAIGDGGDGINDSALIGLTVVHVDPDSGRNIDRLVRREVQVNGESIVGGRTAIE